MNWVIINKEALLTIPVKVDLVWQFYQSQSNLNMSFISVVMFYIHLLTKDNWHSHLGGGFDTKLHKWQTCTHTHKDNFLPSTGYGLLFTLTYLTMATVGNWESHDRFQRPIHYNILLYWKYQIVLIYGFYQQFVQSCWLVRCTTCILSNLLHFNKILQGNNLILHSTFISMSPSSYTDWAV